MTFRTVAITAALFALTPPGSLVAQFKGAVSKEQIVQAVSGSCADGNCGPGGCCPPQ